MARRPRSSRSWRRPATARRRCSTQWAATYDGPVAWLTIDNLDNDPLILMSYLATAFDRVLPIAPETADATSTGGRRILAAAVPRLVSELHRWPLPGLIVLDDAHLLTDRIALDAITRARRPPADLASTSRSPVAINRSCRFARLAADRNLLELGTARAGARRRARPTALVAAAGHALSGDEISVAAVHARRAGRPGIYLAILAMRRGRQDFGPVASFSGSDSHVAAYLRSEFEEGLEPDDMTFLTRSVVLERITPAVAEAVTELPEAGQRLRRLAQRSQLIQELPAAEPTYRYHNLLRDFLAHRARDARARRHQARVHRRAAVWFHAAGETDLAIEHALAAHDFDIAARYRDGRRLRHTPARPNGNPRALAALVRRTPRSSAIRRWR